MSNTRKRAKPSLRELARNAKPRTEHYDIPLVDRDEANEAAQLVSEASAQLKQARIFSDDALVAKAERALADAREAYDACFRRVTFRALPLADQEALNNEHPEPPEGERPEGHVPQVFHLAVASCVNGEDMTAEDWHSLCEDVWAPAEAIAFQQAVWNANQKPYSGGIQKG